MGIYENARKATKEKIKDTFWEMYKTKPISKITVKELSEACAIGRGTFYNHFEDVYAVLDDIENELSFSLNAMCTQIYEKIPSLTDFSEFLYKYYNNQKTQNYIQVLVLEHRDPFFSKDYIQTLKELLYDVCVEHDKTVQSEKEKVIVDGAISSVVILLLNCICTTELTLEETNEIIIGFMQNGIYITLTNRFGIDLLKNPFLL